MSIDKKNKNHLKDHASVVLTIPMIAPKSDDPLRFWSNHPTENTLIDLHPFADGEFENQHPFGTGNWGGPYAGRPKLIADLAHAIQARLMLASPGTISSYLGALRAWWRLFDHIESAPALAGKQLGPVKSVADLNALHEAAAHRSGITPGNFRIFLSIVNSARKLRSPRLPALLWEPPKVGDPVRVLISEDQAREIKTCLKQDWESVRRIWARNDALRAEAQRRAAYAIDPEGTINRWENPSEHWEGDEQLLKNWQHLQRIQQKTRRILPTGKQLLDGKDKMAFWQSGLELRLMRAILFPTVQEADIAFHLALMNSGWNPSTLANLDGSSPSLIFDHPKGTSQSVLQFGDVEDEEITMQADKPRARGKTQYCIGFKKHLSSPPVIVATYLQRVAPLRDQVRSDYRVASAELERLQATNASTQAIALQHRIVQKLGKSCRSVWLYVDLNGEINHLDPTYWNRYGSKDGSKRIVSYLDLLLERLNGARAKCGKPSIVSVKPSDFRDIYARWVYTQTGGNVLAVMLALGHSSAGSTGRYLDNNIFSAENDEHIRRFMAHLFAELNQGRVDLTILAQLVRHGTLTLEMQVQLGEYRQLMRSRMGVACADPRHPPAHVTPGHQEGRLCGTQRCLRECGHARFLPESLDGIAMRVEELVRMSDRLPREAWLRGGFQWELDDGEYLLDSLYPREHVTGAREKWRDRIVRGVHLIPGL